MCALSEGLLYLQDLGNNTGVLKNEANKQSNEWFVNGERYVVTSWEGKNNNA